MIDGGYFFYSHLMMWGRWQVLPAAPEETDRRERARIVVPDAAAILFSAPVFEIGQGDPERDHAYLGALGPDILPPEGAIAFNAACFIERVGAPEHRDRTVGAALLDQSIVAGIGNYLRAEMLFLCGIDPWKTVENLSANDLACLGRTIPTVAAHAYAAGGRTITDDEQERMRREPSLAYPNATGDWSRRHYVFRRTNLPCLRCGDLVRQKRQFTRTTDDGQTKERIIYFCPTCQGVTR